MVPVLEALETALSIFVASWLALAAAVACMAMATGSHLVSAEQFLRNAWKNRKHSKWVLMVLLFLHANALLLSDLHLGHF